MPVGFFCCHLNVLVCAVGIIFCFAPVFAGLVDGDENSAILEELQNSTFFRDASLSTLLVTIPSAVDAVIDMFLNVCDAVTKTVSHEKFSSSVRHLSSKTTAVRLSPSERLGFIIGISSLSYFSIWSTFQPLSLAFYYSFANFSTIMSVCPIVFFLKRCTKLWTPFRSFSLILCISGGSVLSSLSFCFKIGSYEYVLLTYLASTSIGLATFVLLVVCAISIRPFVKNNHESWKKCFFSGALVTYFRSSIQHSRESVKFYKHCVVEIHTIGLIVLCVTNVAWYFIEDDVVSVTSYFMCIQTAIAVMIFVVEIRIRQTEVLRGLVRSYRALLCLLLMMYLTPNTPLSDPLLPSITITMAPGPAGFQEIFRTLHLSRNPHSSKHRYFPLSAVYYALC